MEQEEPSGTATPARRKVRFAPKVPPRRTPKPTDTKTEVVEDEEAAQTRELLRRVNENSRRRGALKSKSTVQVAFGYTGTSTTIRTYGVPDNGSGSSSRGSVPHGPTSDKEILSSSSLNSTTQPNGANAYSEDPADTPTQKLKKEYREPWDYYSYYPVTLPLRRPYSGDPELLDGKEFGEASANSDYDENSINPASELGLMEESEEARMFFLQLPASLPSVKQPTSAKGKNIAVNSKPSRGLDGDEKCCSLEELPAGFMGKMMVYKSGAIKLKLGETLYDVSPGSDCMFAQDVAAINTKDKSCCILGELNKRAVVTPNVDSLLNTVIDLD
ncbi:hypothetical protein HHK36_000937 [Tetracentron sinense]|uniref:Uncharacterized protein n=1 Tax=Tetracentron sinense TaxID=13715 RepID=A0A834ZWD6_TETSI|nr:hypothetical protein HHK36_000937 [Tetracentron sinense]